MYQLNTEYYGSSRVLIPVLYIKLLLITTFVLVLKHGHFIPVSGCGKREVHINWSMVTCEGSTRFELP